MGTRWRGLLAPINMPTGDGRRMAVGAITWRQLPLGLKWQRVDSSGHDDSVIIGSAEAVNVGTVADAIEQGWISAEAVDPSMPQDALGAWGSGDLFDVDAASMPRLAEDVAEALLLLQRRVIGPSVDAGDVTAVMVKTGTDTPLTGEELDQLYMDAMDTGDDPDIEVLFTAYEIAAATLVVIPAFAEARPFELLADSTVTPDVPVEVLTYAAKVATLTASAPPTYPPDVFDAPPAGHEYQVITAEQRPGEDFLRIAGYVAPFGTCHVEFRNACYTAPTTTSDYAPFHRYPVQLDDGTLLGVGRLTTGMGRVGSGCDCCPGKHDHACNSFGLTQTLAHYDGLTTIAHVRATETDLGIWVAGVSAPDLSPAELKALKGGRYSGDWREVGASLEMVEVLALTGRAREGFPPPTVSMRSGRRVALTAAAGWGGPTPGAVEPSGIDYGRIGREVADQLRAHGLLAPPEEPPTTDAPAGALVAATDAPQHTGAMIALRMSTADASRLALDGGEPVDELHATQRYLGEAADWSEEDVAALTTAMRNCAAQLTPFEADPFAVSMFNPTNTEPDGSCVVLGLAGQGIDAARAAITTAAAPFDDRMPDQHVPHVQHITLAYTNDPATVAAVIDRTGTPVLFDAIRVAFAGQVTDIPLGEPAADEAPPVEDTAASLAAAVDEAIAGVAAHERVREAQALRQELEANDVLRV